MDKEKLLDNAACGSQHRPLLDDENVRKAIVLNVMEPYENRIKELEADLEESKAISVALMRDNMSTSKLRAALEEIAHHGTDCPPAAEPGAHYRQVAWALISIARKALEQSDG